MLGWWPGPRTTDRTSDGSLDRDARRAPLAAVLDDEKPEEKIHVADPYRRCVDHCRHDLGRGMTLAELGQDPHAVDGG